MSVMDYCPKCGKRMIHMKKKNSQLVTLILVCKKCGYEWESYKERIGKCASCGNIMRHKQEPPKNPTGRVSPLNGKYDTSISTSLT